MCSGSAESVSNLSFWIRNSELWIRDPVPDSYYFIKDKEFQEDFHCPHKKKYKKIDDKDHKNTRSDPAGRFYYLGFTDPGIRIR
jgi:hypothetical protein